MSAFWRKADVGPVGGERPLLTQSGHSGRQPRTKQMLLRLPPVSSEPSEAVAFRNSPKLSRTLPILGSRRQLPETRQTAPTVPIYKHLGHFLDWPPQAALEEQFYLIFPVICLVFNRGSCAYLRPTRGRRDRPQTLHCDGRVLRQFALDLDLVPSVDLRCASSYQMLANGRACQLGDTRRYII
jgi:hypothetical protein